MPSAMRGVGVSMRGRTWLKSGSGSSHSPRKSPSARRASPSVPEIQMSSPGRAASRRSALCMGTSPNTVRLSVSGPRVVSPPISSQPCASASSSMPAASSDSQAACASGSASASVKARGSAPMAARSDRLTASALWPSERGATSGKKCRPLTSMSVLMARWWPGRPSISAQSSPTPSTALRAGRVKKRRIRSNSESWALEESGMKGVGAAEILRRARETSPGRGRCGFRPAVQRRRHAAYCTETQRCLAQNAYCEIIFHNIKCEVPKEETAGTWSRPAISCPIRD